MATLAPSAPNPGKPELLAPAGDWDCAKAAVENGADAIYFGLDLGFNARARATNFRREDLAPLMEMLHSRGVRGYLTLNTLIFSEELPQLEASARLAAESGVDAVLVQDLGAVRLIRALCPDLPIHASTQMTLTSAESIAVAQSLGVERVVLARELSIREMERIHQKTTMPLEAFVHGALCVAYSGQCLTSESLGGRSANRGQCAQACRMTYELVCDGEDKDLGAMKYLLSPQDLAAFEKVPELIAAGVTCFKIEGRLKTAEYVANITRHYRRAIDAALEGRRAEFTPRDVEEMQLSFSRGFSPGWLEGCEHKRLVPGLSSTKRGIFLGTVRGVRGQRIAVDLACRVKPGDGVVFEGDRAAGPESANAEQGGRVYEMFRDGRPVRKDEEISTGLVELAFEHHSLDLPRIIPGQQLWKTDDPQLTARLKRTWSNVEPQRKLTVDLRIVAATGNALRIEAQAEARLPVRLESAEPLALARKHPLTLEVLRSQFTRLGGTPYELGKVDARIEGEPMVPLSVLGKLRHELVAALDRAVPHPPRRISAASPLAELRAAIPAGAADVAAPAELYVLVRSLSQLRGALAAEARSLYADFQDIREYAEAVQESHAAGATIHLATPRIQKPDEPGIFRVLLRHGADGILVRNLGGLEFYAARQVPFIVDFSLNATNELTAHYLRERGARRITPSYDLNRDQLQGLVGALPAEWLEVVVHQHMPMFHMEHCVFCAVLSPGTNKTNCGRPCDRHLVSLRDHLGTEHPLKADVGCRNTLFNAVPQSGAEVVPWLLAQGVRHFRVETLHDDTAEIGRVLDLYRRLLSGSITGKEVWTQLRAANRLGVTRGTLEERRNPLAIL